jgi:oligoribonuclease NrnB/cAMP/cGMP phosphodiesterase (DHH superfamily)
MKNIFRFSRFILESVKDDIGELGWKEITSKDFHSVDDPYEEFSKDELYYLNEFVSKCKLELSDTWNSNSTVEICKQGEFEIMILKKRVEYFYVRLTFTEPFLDDTIDYIPTSNFIADQRDGLLNLLSEIWENRV